MVRLSHLIINQDWASLSTEYTLAQARTMVDLLPGLGLVAVCLFCVFWAANETYGHGQDVEEGCAVEDYCHWFSVIGRLPVFTFSTWPEYSTEKTGGTACFLFIVRQSRRKLMSNCTKDAKEEEPLVTEAYEMNEECHRWPGGFQGENFWVSRNLMRKSNGWGCV